MSDSQTKQCQNCKQNFRIEPEDFEFYQKIKVPPPTFCPECRKQRRLAWFNLKNLYQRKCDLCGEMKISMYAPGAPFRVYCPKCWWGDGWNPFDYGRDYDFSRPFFAQWRELLAGTPLLGLSIDLPTSVSSPYNNHVGHLKNCYLLFHADMNEDSAYGIGVFQNQSILDCSLSMGNELCYDSLYIFRNYNCIGSYSIFNCLDSFFLKNSHNCKNCFASANLRNKQYYIFNKPHTKEKYFEEIKKWDLGSYKTYQELKNKFSEHARDFPPEPLIEKNNVNISGNYIGNSKNCQECFQVNGAENCKYLFMTESPPITDCYDISSWGNNMSLCYECNVAGENVANIKFCQESGIDFYNGEYCKLSTGGSNHFGCVGVNKGNYCILNKRYGEDEYKNLREKIIKHMEKMPYRDRQGLTYKYGEFFPMEFSPSPYNTTLAQAFYPLTREEVLAKGGRWEESNQKKHFSTFKWEDLPDHIKDTKDDILKENISCRACERSFKIIPMEMAFLRRKNLPLPRQCPFCRIGDKFAVWAENLRMGERTCDKCRTRFETPFMEDKYKKILCLKCWRDEVV